MRFPVLVLLFLAACNCATTPLGSLQSETVTLILTPQVVETADGGEAEEPDIPGPTSRYWVPHLGFQWQINSTSSEELVTRLRQVEAAVAETPDGGTRTPDAVLLEINSGGGSVPAGFLIGKAIEDLGIPVICVVDGDDGAQSMAYWVLQSCDLRAMTRRSVLMLHQPSLNLFGVGGQENDWKNKAESLRVLNRALLEHAARRMSISVDQAEVRTRDQDWFFDWRDALRYRAVDGVVTSVAEIRSSYETGLAPPAAMLTRVPPVKQTR